MMHRKITLALDPTIKPRDFKRAVREHPNPHPDPNPNP